MQRRAGNLGVGRGRGFPPMVNFVEVYPGKNRYTTEASGHSTPVSRAWNAGVAAVSVVAIPTISAPCAAESLSRKRCFHWLLFGRVCLS